MLRATTRQHNALVSSNFKGVRSGARATTRRHSVLASSFIPMGTSEAEATAQRHNALVIMSTLTEGLTLISQNHGESSLVGCGGLRDDLNNHSHNSAGVPRYTDDYKAPDQMVGGLIVEPRYYKFKMLAIL
jgi:hypothetical protein